MPPDVTTAEYNVTSYDGARVTTRWYVKHGAAPLVTP
jgi:hypothetical protein